MRKMVKSIIQFNQAKLSRFLLVYVAGLYIIISLNSSDRFSRDKTQM